jgi:hypothetical protein
LKHFDVQVDAFVEAVKNAKTEDDVVAWFRAHIDPGKKASWKETLLAREVTDENRERIAVRHPIVLRDRSLVRVVDMLEADDRECLGEALAVAT